MTREENFRTSFQTQFTAATLLPARKPLDLAQLALSDFPSYSITLGATRYTEWDNFGNAIKGEQEFTIRLYLLTPHAMEDTALHLRSDFMTSAEQFMRGGYTFPPVGAGDNYRIDALLLLGAEQPILNRQSTRHVVVVMGKYVFTLL
jgi:hypothetical protein